MRNNLKCDNAQWIGGEKKYAGSKFGSPELVDVEEGQGNQKNRFLMWGFP